MMEVDGTLSLWTTLLGWHYYNVVWGLLKNSGIAFIPIAAMVIDHLINARAQGSLMTQRGDSILSGIEVEVFIMLMVFLFAVRPSGVTTLGSGSFQYTPEDSVYRDNINVRTLNSTGTTLDGVATSSDYNIASGNIPIPPLWHVVLQASSGFSYAISRNIDDRDDVYRAVRELGERVAITDPGLKTVIEDFNTQCYTRALGMYRREAANRSDFVEPNGLTATFYGSNQEGVDIGWLGGSTFQQDFYPRIQVENPVAGFAYDSAVDTEFAAGSIPSQGAPNCQEYWDAIRNTIKAKSDAEGVTGIMDRVRGYADAAGLFTIPADGPNYRDGMAEAYLANSEIGLSRTADRILAAGNAGAGSVERVVRVGAEALQALSLVKLAVMAELFTTAMISALVYLQAYTLMILYMAIPLIMVISRYSVSAIFSTVIMIFALKFLPVLWALIAWIDNTNGLALWNGKSMYSILRGGGPEAVTARFVHSVSVALLYATSGGIFFAFLALSGIRSSMVLSNMGSRMTGVGGGITPMGPVGTVAGAVDSRVAREAAKGITSRAGAAAGAAGSAVRSFVRR